MLNRTTRSFGAARPLSSKMRAAATAAPPSGHASIPSSPDSSPAPSSNWSSVTLTAAPPVSRSARNISAPPSGPGTRSPDATVHGSGTHDKTGHHCLPNDPNGKLDIPHHAGYWLHGEDGRLTKAIRHVCWDGCMFPNAMLETQSTWNEILDVMLKVRAAHGWEA